MSLEAWGDEGPSCPEGYVTEELYDELQETHARLRTLAWASVKTAGPGDFRQARRALFDYLCTITPMDQLTPAELEHSGKVLAAEKAEPAPEAEERRNIDAPPEAEHVREGRG